MNKGTDKHSISYSIVQLSKSFVSDAEVWSIYIEVLRTTYWCEPNISCYKMCSKTL